MLNSSILPWKAVRPPKVTDETVSKIIGEESSWNNIIDSFTSISSSMLSNSLSLSLYLYILEVISSLLLFGETLFA